MIAISSRMLRLAQGLFISAALAIGTIGCGGPGAESPSGGGANGLVGSAAPEFDAEKISGEGPTSLKEASGKVVVVDFWGTFCGPCKKSFPKYQELSEKFGSDLSIIAISVDEPEDKGKIPDFIKATGVKFAVVWDKDKSAVKKYSPPTMPSSFIIDKQGVVRHMHVGYHAGEETEIAQEVKELLK
jgi:thiol-disulfide isomerase/thioredoxin